MASLNSISSNLSQKQAALLLRRTTFGPTKSEIDEFTGLSAQAACDILFQEYAEPVNPPIDPKTGLDWVSPKPSDLNSDESDLMQFLMATWLELMRTKKSNIREKMVYFFHTHFTTKKSTVESSTAIYWQIALFRYFALGNYKTLAKKICTDNAMIRFLDGNTNVLGSPQENFAREYLELYTIGKGKEIGDGDYSNYTETDIREAARVLSGYNVDKDFGNIDPDTSLPRGIIKTSTTVLPQLPSSPANQHDEGIKTFSGTLGNGGTTIAPPTIVGDFATIESVYDELDQLVEMIFAKEETAKHICRKLYRFFVYYSITPEIESDIITPLANLLVSSDFEIKPVLEKLLKSEHFYDLDNSDLTDDTGGAIIKSPVELLFGTLRFFEVDFGDTTNIERLYNIYIDAIFPLLEDMGIQVYEPFEVAGYEAYHQSPEYNRHWITASNLGYRYQMIDKLLAGLTDKDGIPFGVKIDVMALVLDTSKIKDPKVPDEIVNFFVSHLFPEEIRTERFEYFRDRILLDNLSIANWLNEWNSYLSSGDDTAVRAQLEALVREIVQSPEYQLF